ncbi:MAG: hypothetical protein CVT67_04195 [Actinobacteria bacterium HGW-Actinobacteria-7]|jgi:hypothetical protein|nr:MAG: hypothetical protein CVT67_04195 [Actinobacteria bacterium HGW-Actinobacteria-7]
MREHDALSKSLAISGTLLLAVPLVAPFVLGLLMMGRLGGFRLDYLMPFEIYPVTVVAMVLVLWVSLRSHIRRGAVAAAIAVMLGGIVLMGVSAQVTGIANSAVHLETWRYVLTSALAAISILGQVALIVEGWLLTRDLSHMTGDPATPLTPAPGA